MFELERLREPVEEALPRTEHDGGDDHRELVDVPVVSSTRRVTMKNGTPHGFVSPQCHAAS